MQASTTSVTVAKRGSGGRTFGWRGASEAFLSSGSIREDASSLGDLAGAGSVQECRRSSFKAADELDDPAYAASCKETTFFRR